MISLLPKCNESLKILELKTSHAPKSLVTWLAGIRR